MREIECEVRLLFIILICTVVIAAAASIVRVLPSGLTGVHRHNRCSSHSATTTTITTMDQVTGTGDADFSPTTNNSLLVYLWRYFLTLFLGLREGRLHLKTNILGM